MSDKLEMDARVGWGGTLVLCLRGLVLGAFVARVYRSPAFEGFDEMEVSDLRGYMNAEMKSWMEAKRRLGNV